MVGVDSGAFELNGFWVTGVENVGDALIQATDIAPDLIVLDIDALAMDSSADRASRRQI